MAAEQERQLVDELIELLGNYLKEGGQVGEVMNVMLFALDQLICGNTSGWEEQTFTYEHCAFTLTSTGEEKSDGEE